jgi:DNA-directed RNA polymerase subunit RPC12/RpoP
VKLPPRVKELLRQEREVPYLAFTAKVAKARCPKCNTRGRLLVGPFYDRGHLICQECGHRMRVKVKL